MVLVQVEVVRFFSENVVPLLLLLFLAPLSLPVSLSLPPTMCDNTSTIGDDKSSQYRSESLRIPQTASHYGRRQELLVSLPLWDDLLLMYFSCFSYVLLICFSCFSYVLLMFYFVLLMSFLCLSDALFLLMYHFVYC